MIWIWWQSVRHTDGRRSSVVGYNTSKAHLLENQNDIKAVCGREVQITRKRRELKAIPDDACARCAAAFTARALA